MGEKTKAQLFNLSFGLSSSDSDQDLGFSCEENGQRPFARQKSIRDVSKVPEAEGEKPKTQVISHISWSTSWQETLELGRQFGKSLQQGDILCLFGDVGAGKTTFTKGVVCEKTKVKPCEVTSPTFTYLNIYEGPENTVYHFDLYRLPDAKAFFDLGFEEYLFSQGICCIEWSEKIQAMLPPVRFAATLIHNGKMREIIYEIPDNRVP
jgi:tRNA threonylcarbamoyladenosine biosynthesis protein TsaE